MGKSPEEMEASMVGNLKEKTGKTIDEWLKVTGKLGAAKHGEIVAHLKEKHGVGHGYANLIAQRTLKGSGPGPSGDDLVELQFAGPKAALRPIYDALAKKISDLGSDVEMAPKKSYVSVRRAKQFAILQPSTATRFDVGINLKAVKPSGRLEASGSFNAMVSHRVKISSAGQIDKELMGWLKQAYEAAG